MNDQKPPMPISSASSRSEIDAATNAYMRKMIGEKLGHHLGTDAPMPDKLQRLLDQLRMQDNSGR